MNFSSQPPFRADAQTLTKVPMPTLSTRLTLLRSTKIGLPSGMSARTFTENMAQESITTLPVQCTMVDSGCLSTSNCKTGVSSAAIDASLQSTTECTPPAYPHSTTLGWNSVPATRLAMQISSDWPAKT